MPPKAGSRSRRTPVKPLDQSVSLASTKAASQQDSGEVTTVTVWLKEQLEEAWKRESHLKKAIKTVSEVKCDKLLIQIEAMER